MIRKNFASAAFWCFLLGSVAGCPNTPIPSEGEVCDNEADDDGDGDVDCDDADCADACGGAELCDNGVDDDGDGLADCLDSDCVSPTCDEICDDGFDNDADALIDCFDSDCNGSCPEVCGDGVDNDGNGLVDCSDPACENTCDADGDGHDSETFNGGDCDDSDPYIHPDAAEICDSVDNDCDGDIDDADSNLTGATNWYSDGDSDGYGAGTVQAQACSAPAGTLVDNADDCDDLDDQVSPGATEVCDGVDNNCDSFVDDDDPTTDVSTMTEWYDDLDGDGLGGTTGSVMACDQPADYADNTDDCDDNNAYVGLPSDWWPDNDLDGFGTGSTYGVVSCISPGTGWAAVWAGEDCNDNNADLNPNTEWWLDVDGDFYGDDTMPALQSCLQPMPGYVLDGEDCDDDDDTINPGANEVCDSIDNNCDTLVDDADPAVDPSSFNRYYFDNDLDGYGDPYDFVDACEAPAGYVEGIDCDDGDPYSAFMDDWWMDGDLDGYGTGAIVGTGCGQPVAGSVPVSIGEDCNDSVDTVHPGAYDNCRDAFDADCNGSTLPEDGPCDTGLADYGWSGDLVVDLAAGTADGIATLPVVGRVTGTALCTFTWTAQDFEHDPATSSGVPPYDTSTCEDFSGNPCDFAFNVNKRDGTTTEGECTQFGIDASWSDGGTIGVGYMEDYMIGPLSMGPSVMYYFGAPYSTWYGLIATAEYDAASSEFYWYIPAPYPLFYVY